MRTSWTEQKAEAQLRDVVTDLGRFPSTSELRSRGRNDLSCYITKHGGMRAWADRLGMDIKQSDTKFGLDGEEEFAALLAARGYSAELTSVKAPYDILVNSVLRIDVKTARYAEYENGASGGTCTGWFFRIGKDPQADLIILYQFDTKHFHAVPHFDCPRTNVTITKTGKRYQRYENAWDVIETMLRTREAERELLKEAA